MGEREGAKDTNTHWVRSAILDAVRERGATENPKSPEARAKYKQ